MRVVTTYLTKKGLPVFPVLNHKAEGILPTQEGLNLSRVLLVFDANLPGEGEEGGGGGDKRLAHRTHRLRVSLHTQIVSALLRDLTCTIILQHSMSSVHVVEP